MSEGIKELVKRLRAFFTETRIIEVGDVHAAADALEALAGEVASLQNTFDLMWDADQRAIKLWQHKTGKDHIWPDKARTTLWLLERLEAAEAERDRLAGEVMRLRARDDVWLELDKIKSAERDRLKRSLQDCVDAYDFVIVDEYDRGWSSVSDAIHAARKALGGDAS